MSWNGDSEARLDEMMGQAEKFPPSCFMDLLPLLNQIVLPFVESLFEPEQKRHALEYITGLVSGLECKTAEGIAYPMHRIKNGRESRSLLDLCRGTINPCSPPWQPRSARSWV